MRAFTLPLVKPVATGHGPISSRQGHFIRLTDGDGHFGHGEATPLVEFGTEDGSRSEAALGQGLEDLLAAQSFSLEEGLALISQSALDAPCARAALDSALHDLAAQQAGKPLSSWLHARAGLPGHAADNVKVQAIVEGDDARQVQESAKRLMTSGFDAFKLKLATSGARAGIETDLERVAALREAVGPERRIRLDANEAWSLAEAMKALAAFEPFKIDFVEQPVGRSDLAGLKELDQHGAVAVAADEALLGSAASGDPGWSACLEMRAASILIVKPAALGGIEPSMALAARARALGLRVVWSSLIDGAVSRAVAVALAAALGGEGEVHGLGTARLLARDLVESDPELGDVADVSQGSIRLGNSNGLDWAFQDLAGARSEIWGRQRFLESRS